MKMCEACTWKVNMDFLLDKKSGMIIFFENIREDYHVTRKRLTEKTISASE